MRNELCAIRVCELSSLPEVARLRNSQTAFQQRLAYQIFDTGSTFQWQVIELWITDAAGRHKQVKNEIF